MVCKSVYEGLGRWKRLGSFLNSNLSSDPDLQLQAQSQLLELERGPESLCAGWSHDHAADALIAY